MVVQPRPRTKTVVGTGFVPFPENPPKTMDFRGALRAFFGALRAFFDRETRFGKIAFF